jgi:hypothetical protein
MVIDKVNQACGFVEGGEFLTFDSPGCLLEAYNQRRSTGMPLPAKIYFADYHDSSLHPAESTTFLLTEQISTVMDSRVLTFSSRAGASQVQSHPDEKLTNWIGYRTARGRPNRTVKVTFHRSEMSPEVVLVDKGDLVLLELFGNGLEADLEIEIAGYPEIEAVTVPATGEKVELRMLAQRPGDGFPVIVRNSGEALGRVRVTGPHTLDEEEM